MTLFGSSGARGPVEGEMPPATVTAIARAAVTEWEADRVAIGRDGRLTGPALAAAATAGATSGGADVVRLGVAPTPAIQHFAAANDLPAMVITASHNPPTDNGIKLAGPGGGEIPMDEYRSIGSRVAEGPPPMVDWHDFGSVEHVDGVNRRYAAALSAALRSPRVEDGGLHVVVDPANGPGGLATPRVLRSLGCTVDTINADLDGRFPNRRPEPIPDALEDLREVVPAMGADLGVAHDGDADRAVFVDETGTVIDGGAVFAALAEAVVEPGEAIVTGVTASRRLRDVADRTGARLELTRVGAAHIITRVRELQADGTPVAIAGEENGGIVFPEHRLTRDGAYTAGRVLALVVDEPASTTFEPYSDLVFRRTAVRYDTADERGALMERAREWATSADGSVTSVDGYRLDREEGWVLIRASGTEPLLRIYAEASDAATAESLLATAKAAITGDR